MCVSIEIRYEKSMYVSTRPRCRRDCQKGEGDRVVYDAFASSLSRWKDAKEVGMIEFGLSTGRGGGSIFGRNFLSLDPLRSPLSSSFYFIRLLSEM